MLQLNVTRQAVTLQGDDRQSQTTRSLVALCVEGFRVGITGVGEDETELARRLTEQARNPSAGQSGFSAQILRLAGPRVAEVVPQDRFRFLRPGDDPWWDRKWQDVYELKNADRRRAQPPREILMLNPLASESWSPHLIRGLLMYVLWTSPHTADRTFPHFRRPPLELHASSDFTVLEYGELVDQLKILWGERRVHLPEGRTVSAPPVTRMQRIYRMSRIAWWALVAIALLMYRPGQAPSQGAIFAGALATIAIVVNRIAKGRMLAELPRRQSSTSAG